MTGYYGIWVIQVANLGAMDDRDLTVKGYYRNDDVLTESIVIFIIVFGIWVMGDTSGKSGCNGRP